jgi:hypothetical protein
MHQIHLQMTIVNHACHMQTVYMLSELYSHTQPVHTFYNIHGTLISRIPLGNFPI